MDAFTVHHGTAVALRRNDVDTDQIIPSDYLKRVSRTGFGEGLFAQWRSEPGFVLDRPEHAGASVLVVGTNFGTGSSREHAVWALQDFGFRAVVSPRFADIFRGNATKNGLLPVVLPPDAVADLQDLVEADPQTPVTVDLQALQLSAGDRVWAFEIDDDTRWRLLNGHDDIGLTLRHAEAVSDYEKRRHAWLPTTAPCG